MKSSGAGSSGLRKLYSAWEKERSWSRADEGSATYYRARGRSVSIQCVNSRVLPTRRRRFMAARRMLSVLVTARWQEGIRRKGLAAGGTWKPARSGRQPRSSWTCTAWRGMRGCRYSYANTSVTVRRTARRAGNRLATTEMATTRASQANTPPGENDAGTG